MADRQDAPNVAIVTEDVAARAWPGEDPLGKRLKFGELDSDAPWRTVVGIARSTRYRDLRVPRSTLYLPAEQFLVTAQTLVLRTSLPIGDASRLIRERVRAIDPDVQVMPLAPFGELLADTARRSDGSALS